jgi:thiosulfate dehydrogenase [quinone] large subunit
MPSLSRLQQVALVMLRTLIGWHFLYEGYYKLHLPGWSRAGDPLPAWSAAGYLKAASGPFAGLFHRMADSTMLSAIDWIVPVGLLLVGLSLMLGVLTQAGCLGALAFLALFYLSQIPTTGMPQVGAEGAYLLVNKNLIEWAAVLVLLVFRTGEIAGLDLVWSKRRPVPRAESQAQAAFVGLAPEAMR